MTKPVKDKIKQIQTFSMTTWEMIKTAAHGGFVALNWLRKLIHKLIWVIILAVIVQLATSNWKADFALYEKDLTNNRVRVGHFSPAHSGGILGFEKGDAQTMGPNRSASYAWSMDGSISVDYKKNYLDLKRLKVDLGLGVLHNSAERKTVPRFVIEFRF